jgi:hypothetical protein
MIMTHYVTCSNKEEHWSYKKAKKKLYTALANFQEEDIPNDIAYILYHCSRKNAKKIANIAKKNDYMFIEYK